MDKPGKKMTIKDVAEIVGVSPSTVSLVLNNKGNVGAETRQRILDVLKANNYDLNRAKKNSNRTFMFIKYIDSGKIVDENQGFISEILDQIELSCSERGIQLIIKVIYKSASVTIMSEILSSKVDGIFVLGTELDAKQLPLLQHLNVPFLVIDNICRYFRYPSLTMSNFEAVFAAVNHLYNLGHREIGYLASSLRISNFEERETSFINALASHELPNANRINLTPTIDGAYSDMLDYINNGGHIAKAYSADNDTIAIGAMKALQKSGYNIPEDVSIVGMDDIPYSAVTTPPLTTVKIDRRAIGRIAVKILDDLTSSDSSASPPIRMFVVGDVVVRGSTSIPKKI